MTLRGVRQHARPAALVERAERRVIRAAVRRYQMPPPNKNPLDLSESRWKESLLMAAVEELKIAYRAAMKVKR